MNTCLTHRGPDDEGYYVGVGVGLAARRLSIIDLPGGHQPLSNEACAEGYRSRGPVWLVYNGEVYNHAELRRELEAQGHLFRTRTDTETIIHAYEEWGARSIARLRGMFAFALWDARRRRLLLARDRFGIKPLYYAQSGGVLAFASEIRPILTALPGLPRRADPGALWHLFGLGFIPSPRTIFPEVRKLPAAHYLAVDADSGPNAAATPTRYWSLDYPAHDKLKLHTQTDAVEGFVAHLRDAVDAWRLSDVPVGSLLSGGVDSASLAVLLQETIGSKIATFSIGFGVGTHDESSLARETARYLGSDHHELSFTPDDFDHLPAVVYHLEEPQCSATSVPLFLLYRACHAAGFKVILTGEGADELLGGYHWFDGDARLRPLLALPRAVRAALARLPLPASAAARRVLARGHADPVGRYFLWHEVASPGQRSRLLTWLPPPGFGADAGREATGPRAPYAGQISSESLAGRSPLDQFLYLESRTRLVDFINFEVDRMSMAHSVEARTPFLDHRLWEFCARLPPECKLTDAGDKLLLRLGMAGRLPAAVLRRPKRGLAAPHAEWWRARRLPPWAEDALEPPALTEAGYFHPAEVLRLRQLHRTRHADASRTLMGVLTTQIWHFSVNS